MRPHPHTSRATGDLLLLAIAGTVMFFLMTTLELFGHLAQWLHAQQLVDDLLSLLLVLVGGVAIFSWRRWRELEAIQQELRVLSGVIHICAWCRKARNDAGHWIPLEDYVRRESDADLSPDLCPDCARRLPAPGARRSLF
jgi:hypothetical protein